MQLKKILLLPTPRVIVNTLDDTPDTLAELVAETTSGPAGCRGDCSILLESLQQKQFAISSI